MSEDQGRSSSAIPRWVTGLNLAVILTALAVVVPIQVRASHSPAPTDLCLCFRLSATAPKLVWNDTASQSTIQGYILQRSRTSDFTSDVIEIRIARNTFDFTDETIQGNIRLWYRVASYAGTDRSAWSNVVTGLNGTATYPGKPATPTNISVEPSGTGLRVSWSNPATNETGVWVLRSGDNGATWEYRASLSLNSTSFVDNDPPAGAPMYKVATFNSSGASYSYAVQYVNQSAPGVPTVGQIPQPSIPQASVPGVPTLGGLPTVGVPTVGIPSVPVIDPSPLITPWLNMIPSNPTAIASPWLNMVPSNPQTLVPAVPTFRDPMTYRLWVGVRIGSPQNQPVGMWILPASCFGFGCPPPPTQPPTVCLGLQGFAEFCYLADATL